MQGNVSKIKISHTEIHELFVDFSEKFNFRAEDYTDELSSLIELWESQGYIEIYAENHDRAYGRAKDSSNSPGAIPFYLDLFHVRLSTTSPDPLVTLVFIEKDGDKIASLRFILNHDDMFGSKNTGQKFNREQMRTIRMQVDSLIQQGNN